jgi:hypothetical protein
VASPAATAASNPITVPDSGSGSGSAVANGVSDQLYGDAAAVVVAFRQAFFAAAEWCDVPFTGKGKAALLRKWAGRQCEWSSDVHLSLCSFSCCSLGGASALLTFICVLFVLLLWWCECFRDVYLSSFSRCSLDSASALLTDVYFICSLHSAHAILRSICIQLHTLQACC